MVTHLCSHQLFPADSLAVGRPHNRLESLQRYLVGVRQVSRLFSPALYPVGLLVVNHLVDHRCSQPVIHLANRLVTPPACPVPSPVEYQVLNRRLIHRHNPRQDPLFNLVVLQAVSHRGSLPQCLQVSPLWFQLFDLLDNRQDSRLCVHQDFLHRCRPSSPPRFQASNRLLRHLLSPLLSPAVSPV